MEYYGTLKITNPITLQKWKDNGKYQEVVVDLEQKSALAISVGRRKNN